MSLHVSIGGRGDRASGIYRQVRDAIVDGRLPPGGRLPASRELAAQLSVSRTTVALAYERLTAEGYVSARVGAGTFVCQDMRAGRAARTAPSGGIAPTTRWQEPHPDHDCAPPPPDPVRYDLRVGVPDAGLFPLQAWRRLIAKQLRLPLVRAGDYRHTAGVPRLRAAIARHLGLARSVHAGADDVLVTHGAQQAVDLLARVLIEPGEHVAVEEPGYPPVRRLLERGGAHVIGVPVDDEGLDVSAIPDGVRLVYVTPSHQFPLGVTMSLRRRVALLDWAARSGAAIIEDDYDSEFRFAPRPLEPLQSLDARGHVAYVGSFSKTMAPMLRIGFVIAPTSLRPALHAAKRLADWRGDPVVQGAMADFIDEGLLARHVRRAGAVYGRRRELLGDAVCDRLGGHLGIVPSAAGLHVCTRRVPGSDTDLDAAAALAASRGIAVEPLAGYCAVSEDQAAWHGLVLGYGAIDENDIPEAVRRLGHCLRAATEPAR